jgi:Endodeoxyribonuclease RusA
LTDELYGVLYHFFRANLKMDADNLSKPIWDCLTGFLYVDDSQVKLRIAGSFDLSKHNFNILDIETLPKPIVDELVDAFKNHDRFVYIECGRLNYSMFKFNFENNAY